VTEFVAVSANPTGRTAYHDLEDGEPACGLAKKADHEFTAVPREQVSALDRCQHCSGAATASGGQGSALAAKLAAADPEEVSTP